MKKVLFLLLAFSAMVSVVFGFLYNPMYDAWNTCVTPKGTSYQVKVYTTVNTTSLLFPGKIEITTNIENEKQTSVITERDSLTDHPFADDAYLYYQRTIEHTYYFDHYPLGKVLHFVEAYTKYGPVEEFATELDSSELNCVNPISKTRTITKYFSR